MAGRSRVGDLALGSVEKQVSIGGPAEEAEKWWSGDMGKVWKQITPVSEFDSGKSWWIPEVNSVCKGSIKGNMYAFEVLTTDY